MWVWGILALFDDWKIGLIPFATFIVLNYIFYRYTIFRAMDAEDSTPGTVYFAFSITLLYALFWRTDGSTDRATVATGGVMAMTWGDALASIVGGRWGRRSYTVWGHRRTFEGSAMMFLASFVALLITLVLLFSFKGEVILANPLTILWIAIPLFIQTMLIFGLGYGLAKILRLSYQDAAPTAMIGASNHFEVAIATSVMLFGLSSGAALATVVGVLIEVPVMLMLVRICLRTEQWFVHGEAA